MSRRIRSSRTKKIRVSPQIIAICNMRLDSRQGWKAPARRDCDIPPSATSAPTAAPQPHSALRRSQRASKEVKCFATNIAVDALKEPVYETIGRTSKGRIDASLYWALVVIVSPFQSPPDNAYFSDETPTGQLSLYFIGAVFAALFLKHLTHNDWGLSRHAIRIDALWIAAFVGTVWGSKSVFGKNAK